MGFHQNADLFYLTGISAGGIDSGPGTHAFDEKLREGLFLREPNEQLRIWEGHNVHKERRLKSPVSRR